MLKYKLTSQNNMTFNNTLWGENVTHETDGSGELCGPGWLHFYHTPELAVLLNPTHANIKDPKLWECEAEGQMKDDYGSKGGCTRLTTIREISLPEISFEERLTFGILCVHKAFGKHNEKWHVWAKTWLDGSDRSAQSAEKVRGVGCTEQYMMADCASVLDGDYSCSTLRIAWAIEATIDLNVGLEFNLLDLAAEFFSKKT